MDLLFPDEGLVQQIKLILNGVVHYHLYSNDVTPDLSTILADLIEAAWPGYGGPIPRVFTDYALTGVASHKAYAIGDPISFGNSSGVDQNTYGYYVTDAANSMLIAVARFDGAPLVISDGTTLDILPTWGTLSQLSS